jgi:hypothetical protein
VSENRKLSRRDFLHASALSAAGVLAASCAQPTAQVIEKEVPVEKIVKETVVVEKEVPVEKVVKETVVVEKEMPVEKIVKETVVVEKVVTATPVPSKYKEAPELAALVESGKLPPLEERLPGNPVIIQPVDRIGKYGGDWNTALVGAGDSAWIARTIQYEQLVRWDRPWTKVAPNVAESWEAQGTKVVGRCRVHRRRHRVLV